MPCLLFVDDDPNILKINRNYFEVKGYSVVVAKDAKMAIDYAEQYPIDCIVLDILMPETDGFALCEQIKKKVNVPIIFLTSATQKEYLYQGFSLGGDDFMTKPYDLRELEIRINTRISQHGDKRIIKKSISYPPLILNIGNRTALIDEEPVALTANEFDILLLLASHPEHVFSLPEIYKEIWKLPDLGNAQTVKVHVARMRHKLEAACPEKRYVGTVWKRGYQFINETNKEEND